MLQEALSHHAVAQDERASLVALVKLAKSALCLHLEGGAGAAAAAAGPSASDELAQVREELAVARLRVLLAPGDPRVAEAAVVELVGDRRVLAPGAGAAALHAEHARTLLEACAVARVRALVGKTLLGALEAIAAGR